MRDIDLLLQHSSDSTTRRVASCWSQTNIRTHLGESRKPFSLVECRDHGTGLNNVMAIGITQFGITLMDWAPITILITTFCLHIAGKMELYDLLKGFLTT